MLHRERKLVKGPNWLAKPYIYTRKTSSVSVRVARVDSEQLELSKALRHQSFEGRFIKIGCIQKSVPSLKAFAGLKRQAISVRSCSGEI